MRKMILTGSLLGFGVLASACGSGNGDAPASAPTSQPAAGAPYATPTAGSPAAPVTVESKKTSLGTILVDQQGMTLYLFEKDKNGKSACDGACAQAWPPLVTNGKAMPGSGLKASLLGTTTRSDGTTQVTYHGWPLYYYADDEAPGDMKGQDLDDYGAEWYVISATTGKKLEK